MKFLTPLILVFSVALVAQSTVSPKVPRAGATPPVSPPQAPAPAAVSRPSSTPTPTTNAMHGRAVNLVAPTYSPAMLDFGTVDYHGSAKRTFSLTVPSAGEVSLEFPWGCFVPLAIRTLPPFVIGQGQNAQMQTAPPIHPEIPAQNNQLTVYKYTLAAGAQLQVDVALAPSFNPFSKDKNSGLKDATMRVNGPGATGRWTVLIPMHGEVTGMSTKSSVFPESGSLPVQSSASSAVSHPSPTPTPPRPNPVVAPAPAPISTGPQYSPAQLDFGSLWDGESAKRTLSLTAPAAGQVTLSFPGGGLFWLAEYRELGPATGASKNSPSGPMRNSIQRQLKSRTTYQTGQPVSPFLQWNVSAGSEIQIDVVFLPVSHPKGSTGAVAPGPKSIIMELSGPGLLTPWSIKVPARGMFNGAKTQAFSAPGNTGAPGASAQPMNSAASRSIAGAAPVTAAPMPTPAPNPSITSAQTPVSSAFTPVHWPDQLSFGTVWQGDMTKQTFHFQSLGNGYIHVDLPSPFRVSEVRALSGGGSSKNSGKSLSQTPLGPQIKTRVTFTANQAGPYTALIDASTEVEVDVVFQPQLQSAPGSRSAIMKITGPGSMRDWGMSIPLHGAVQAGLEASPSQLWAIGNDEGAYLEITIHGTTKPVSGTLKAGNVLPPGISIPPQSVNVPAAGSIQTKLWLAFNGIPTDAKARPLQIVFEASNHSTAAQIQFAGVPESALEINSGDRGDCGVSQASLSLHITPPHQQKTQRTKGRRGWVFLSWNFDLANNRWVEMSAESGGVQLFKHLPFTVPMRNMDQFRDVSPYMEDFDVSAEDWQKILQGPARFGCQQWDVTPGGAIAPKGSIKWAAAVKGLKF